jgi:DNA invertase Pin-like site-specific DNA recombinase
MRVAIYARVSTDKSPDDRKRQDPENQLIELRSWCARAGHEIVDEYVDRESGATDRRPRFKAMYEDAHRRKFDLVLFWALDRFSREGMKKTVEYLQKLASCGVGFHSYVEPFLTSENEMIRDILLAVMSALAKQDRVRIVERVKAGLHRARLHGTRSGRPIGGQRIPAKKEKEVAAALLKGDRGMQKIARDLSVGVSVVQRVKAQLRGQTP